MSNNNVPTSHQAGSKQGLSVAGDAHSPQIRRNLSVNTDQPAIIEVPDSAGIEGSENNTILLDRAQELVAPLISHLRHSRPRRNVGPTKFFGDRLFINVVLENDDRTTESVKVQDDNLKQTGKIFFICLSSDLLTSLEEAPPIPTLVAEIMLILSPKKPYSSERANYMRIISFSKNTTSGSYSSLQPTIHDTLDEVEKTSDISSIIDTDVKARLDDFDTKFN